MAKPSGKSQASESKVKPSTSPQKWWHWILVYPTLLISIVTSIPTYLELIRSHRIGVAYGDSKVASEQNDLWRKNLACSAAPIEGWKNEFNIETDAIICRSGDVLVRFRGPNKETAYRWVPVTNFSPSTASKGLDWIGSALAAEAQKNETSTREKVLCQELDKEGFVIRRISDLQTNRCYEEKIRTYTGEVVQRRPIPCDAKCGNR